MSVSTLGYIEEIEHASGVEDRTIAMPGQEVILYDTSREEARVLIIYNRLKVSS